MKNRSGRSLTNCTGGPLQYNLRLDYCKRLDDLTPTMTQQNPSSKSIFLKRLAAWLAVYAIILQSAIPLGWMPAPEGAEGYLVLCSGNGLTGVYLDGDGNPLTGEDDAAAAHTPCDFATASHLASPTPDVALPGPSTLATGGLSAQTTFTTKVAAYLLAHSRAPPQIA